MTNIVDVAERAALVLFLRSKTALGRLNDSEVHSVLTFLESIGFTHQVAAPVAPVAPVSATDLAPAPVSATVLTPDAQLAQVLPIAPAPVSVLANLESIIEKDVKAFFEPAPIAPPPAQ